MENPTGYGTPTKMLLHDIGIKLSRFDTAFDQGFYKRNGLGAGVFFNSDDWGTNRLVHCDLGSLTNYIPFAPNILSAIDAAEQMPMSIAARAEIVRLLSTTEDRLADIPQEDKEDYLYSISYREFLSKHLDITEPEVFAVMQNLATDSGVDIETATAADSLFYVALPGRNAIGMPDNEDDPYIHHFPDGNASIARLLVRSMIPDVAPGSTMEDIVTARFDYDKLDRADAAVRLRLNSTVIHVENDGGPETAKQVNVSYVHDGRASRVKARHCVDDMNDERYPHVQARKPLGRIAIANSDAGASASVDSAVMQAYRAVDELVG